MTASLAVLLGSPLTVRSQNFYVVVGAFATDENASEFRSYFPVRSDTVNPVSKEQNMLHLYVLKAPDKETAISKTLRFRNEIEGIASTVSETHVEDRGRSASAGDMEATASASASEASSAGGGIPSRPVGKHFKFKIESPEGMALPGQLHHVDFARERELAAYDANTFVDLLRPGQSNEPMAVVCGIFGYKEIYKYIDYADPSSTDEEAYLDSDGAWVIPYKLERLEKGDVSLMNNVSFYKDAAIMRQESRIDLDELVKMMHSNPYYEITIHAHCNGKNKREIIAPGPDKNYFDAGGAIVTTGSAKQLTMLRAEAIRGYLKDHGVDESRIGIFSWGASDMLVKADSEQSFLNDRIEIEITRD